MHSILIVFLECSCLFVPYEILCRGTTHDNQSINNERNSISSVNSQSNLDRRLWSSSSKKQPTIFLKTNSFCTTSITDCTGCQMIDTNFYLVSGFADSHRCLGNQSAHLKDGCPNVLSCCQLLLQCPSIASASCVCSIHYWNVQYVCKFLCMQCTVHSLSEIVLASVGGGGSGLAGGFGISCDATRVDEEEHRLFAP